MGITQLPMYCTVYLRSNTYFMFRKWAIPLTTGFFQKIEML